MEARGGQSSDAERAGYDERTAAAAENNVAEGRVRGGVVRQMRADAQQHQVGAARARQAMPDAVQHQRAASQQAAAKRTFAADTLEERMAKRAKHARDVYRSMRGAAEESGRVWHTTVRALHSESSSRLMHYDELSELGLPPLASVATSEVSPAVPSDFSSHGQGLQAGELRAARGGASLLQSTGLGSMHYDGVVAAGSPAQVDVESMVDVEPMLHSSVGGSSSHQHSASLATERAPPDAPIVRPAANPQPEVPLPQPVLPQPQSSGLPYLVKYCSKPAGVDRAAGLQHVAPARVEQAAVAEHVPDASAQLHNELIEWWYSGGDRASGRLRKEHGVVGMPFIGWLCATTGHELDGSMARIRALAERAERVAAEQAEARRKAAEWAAAAEGAADRQQQSVEMPNVERPSVEQPSVEQRFVAWPDEWLDVPEECRPLPGCHPTTHTWSVVHSNRTHGQQWTSHAYME